MDLIPSTHNNKLLQLTVHNLVRYSYFSLKESQQFFYMQETNLSINLF